jgi:hypothetical protein
MGKTRTSKSKRGRIIPLLAAGVIGYVMGGWHVTALRDTEHGSAAEAVALRFPADRTNAPPVATTVAMTGWAAAAEMFSRVPMVPHPQMRAQAASQQQDAESAATQSSDPRATMQTASLENAVASPARPAAEMPTRPSESSVKPAKASAPAARPLAINRSAYVLDDAQIASIKTRLHLTPGQEQMWPAVEAALRHIAYNRAQQARERGAASMQAESFDPNAVQGLKSAAVPLIMSFNEEQKEEVRNIAHVMGLDQLASQF